MTTLKAFWRVFAAGCAENADLILRMLLEMADMPKPQPPAPTAVLTLASRSRAMGWRSRQTRP